MIIGTKNRFTFIILMLFITDLAILFNIPFLRQIIGFLFLTILPGLLILQNLKLNKMDFLEKFILSWGISISFLLFFGLLLNNLSLSLGYETPLSTIPLLIAFNLTFIVLAIAGYNTNKNPIFFFPNLNLSTSEKAFLIVPILLPALTILGTHVMNTTDNNIILMFLLFLIPIYVASICIFNQKFPKRLYPIVIYLISISLLLLMALRSDHLIGADTHTEYYYFQTTLSNIHWSVFGHSTLDACLIISLLPTIFQSILNVPSELLFKVLYPLIYSISPLIIYILSKKYIGESYAFLASCFFMFQQNFLNTTTNARTCIAVMFFALAMMTLFNDKIDPLKKKILFIVFIASCMVSHYSTTYIFFFIMLGAFIGMEIVSKKYTVKKVVSLTIVILFFSMVFFWYSQITEAAFNAGVGFIENTLSNLNRFFVEESRGGGPRAIFGEGIGQKGIPHKIEFIFTWTSFAFIGVGIITLIRRYKEMSFPELNFKRPEFLKDKFEVTHFMISLLCAGLLIAMVALPFVSKGYGIDRVYTTAITILSVFFVIGGITLSRYLKVRAYLIILLVLIPYFLCVTGVMYNLFGVPRAIILNSEGAQYDLMYVHDQESYGAKWLKSNTNEKAKIYADWYGTARLKSQGMIRSPRYAKSLIEDNKSIKEGYIYLRYTGVVNGKLMDRNYQWHNITEYSDEFARKDIIYSNGGSEIYR